MYMVNFILALPNNILLTCQVSSEQLLIFQMSAYIYIHNKPFCFRLCLLVSVSLFLFVMYPLANLFMNISILSLFLT